MQPHEPPTFVPLTPRTVNKDRNGGFGLVLFLVSCFTLAATLWFMMGGARALEILEKKAGRIVHVDPKWASYLVAMEVAALVCVGGTWMWKKWGIYGYFAAQTLVVIVVFKATGHWPVVDMIPLGLMAMTALPRIHMFD